MTTSHDPCPQHDTGDCAGRGLSRRHALAGAAVTGISASFLAACGGDSAGSASDGGGSESEGSSGGQSGPLAASSEIPEGGGMIFGDAGVVVTQPAAGEFKGFSTTCTHSGCAVNEVTETINCPCHGSQFSIEDGSAMTGPAQDPLEEIPITMDGDQIVLG